MIGKQIHAKGCGDAFKEGGRNCERSEAKRNMTRIRIRITFIDPTSGKFPCYSSSPWMSMLPKPDTWGAAVTEMLRFHCFIQGKSSVYWFWLREDGRQNEPFQIKPLLYWQPPQRRTLINLTTLPTIPVALVIMLATNPLKRMIWNFTGGPDIIRSASCCMSATLGLMECVNIYGIISHTPGQAV